MLLIAVLVVSLASLRWSPQFDSQNLTNKTLQLAFAAHPPLREWVHGVMRKRNPDWRSVDDVLKEYEVRTSNGLFLNDVLTIDMEYELRLGIDTKGGDLDTESIYELKELLAKLKSNRKKMDPSGGVNSR